MGGVEHCKYPNHCARENQQYASQLAYLRAFWGSIVHIIEKSKRIQTVENSLFEKWHRFVRCSATLRCAPHEKLHMDMVGECFEARTDFATTSAELTT